MVNQAENEVFQRKAGTSEKTRPDSRSCGRRLSGCSRRDSPVSWPSNRPRERWECLVKTSWSVFLYKVFFV